MKAGGKCHTCGHQSDSAEHVAHVEAHNVGVDKKLVELRTKLGGVDAQCLELSKDLQTLVDLQRTGRTRDDDIRRKFGDNVELDTNFVPAKVSWKGAVVLSTPATVEADALQALEAKQRAGAQAEGRASSHRAQIADIDDRITKANAALASLVKVDLMPLQQAYDQAYAAYSSNAAVLREKRALVDSIRVQLNSLRNAMREAKGRVTAAEARVVEVDKDLQTLIFNNGLVKKLKGLKPLITDHLWNTVLAAVSTFFSQMRGEQSVVSKDKDGFKVNGQKISSLSGSTLDVLALAIRVALTKTFIPHASFMTLDEPAHGCDQERTGNVLGFLAGVGFDQVLLASHDDLSEAVADHVIALGA
jgi:DNA repair exonuclease SbcCD ATPase subunit